MDTKSPNIYRPRPIVDSFNLFYVSKYSGNSERLNKLSLIYKFNKTIISVVSFVVFLFMIFSSGISSLRLSGQLFGEANWFAVVIFFALVYFAQSLLFYYLLRIVRIIKVRDITDEQILRAESKVVKQAINSASPTGAKVNLDDLRDSIRKELDDSEN